MADSGAWTPSARQGHPLERGHTRGGERDLSACPFPCAALETKFDVEVTFRMTPEDLARPAFDLDNFVKPVLDTLFTSQNVSPRVTGVLFPVNDTWVFRLVLQKVGVETPQDQGADITVTSHPPGAPDLSTASASPSA